MITKTPTRPAATGGLARYIVEVRGRTPLDREKERELVESFQTRGDVVAKNRLLEAHLREVVAIALGYRRYGVPIEDLIAEGNLGLIHALDKFDPRVGTRFMSYASYWVRACMIQLIVGGTSVVRSSRLRSKLFFKVRRERARAQNLLGEGEQADSMVARTLDMTKERVKTLYHRLDARDVSLDTPVLDDSRATLLDTLSSPEPGHDERFARAEAEHRRRRALASAIRELDARERLVIERRHLSSDDEGLSLAEIGRTLGVSRERARQLETRAKQKLRQRLATAAGIAD